MKGKRQTTEDKIRILRAADGGKSIVEICKEKNISEQTSRGIFVIEPCSQNSFRYSPLIPSEQNN
jgi:hypothetical protein